MKISVLSDFHFGLAYIPELEHDAFENAEEAMEKALDSDIILIGGDIFDTRIPKTQTWAKAIKVLVKPLLKENTGVKLVECSKELKPISQRTLNHLPVIALHGNHERRGKDEINAVEALENAGILIYLHCNTIIFDKDGIRVAIHGMSHVPERFAKDVLYQWNPTPIKDCFNILFLHQSVDPFVYSPLEPPTLTLSNLPKGFDLIINGHIHSHNVEKIDATPFIIVGSTTITQLEESEASTEKGIVEIEINDSIKVNFKPLKNIRKFFYDVILLDKTATVRSHIENRINEILKENFDKKPLIKLRIVGREVEVLDQELRDIEKKYAARAIVLFTKELETQEMIEKIQFLRNLREQKLSIEEIGLQLLRKNLDELKFTSSFDYDQIFKLLSDNEIERVFTILLGEQATLRQILRKQAVN